jgi:DNA-binding GntR family transcriptional regulator
MPTSLPRLDNVNLWDKTYNLLKDRILHRKFLPSEKLSIPELSSQLGVSRTPIRDALNRLEMEGLVRTIPKVGTYVTAIKNEDVLDIMDTRLMLELWVAEKLSGFPVAALRPLARPLEDLLHQSRTLLERGQTSEYLRSDFNLQFHIAFMRLGDNKRNLDIYLSMMGYHALAVEQDLFTTEMVMSALGQHETIVESLKQGEFGSLRTSIRQHLEDSRERLMNRIQKAETPLP